MTTREFYQTLINYANGEEVDYEAMRSKAQELIAALDAKNEKRKTTLTKEQREAAQRILLVKGFFEKHNPDEFFTRDDIAAATGMKPAEATAACKVLVTSGEIVKGEAKIDKSRRVVYSVPEGAQYLDREVET